jgi:hypothetical protein
MELSSRKIRSGESPVLFNLRAVPQTLLDCGNLDIESVTTCKNSGLSTQIRSSRKGTESYL